MAAMLTLQPTDCFRRSVGVGGVHASSAYRRPRQQQCAAAAAATAPPHSRAPKLARPPVSRRGRANGRQPRPRSGVPQARAMDMENVVILKRGERIAPEIMAALPVAADLCGVAVAAKAEPVAATEDRCCATAEDAEPVTADGQGVAPAKKDEDAVVPEQRVSPEKKAEQCVAPEKKAGPMEEAEQCVYAGNMAEHVAKAAVQCVTPAKMDEAEAAAASPEAEQRISTTASSAEPAVVAADAEQQCIAPVENAEPVSSAAETEHRITTMEIIPQTVAAASTRRAAARKPRPGRVSYGGASFMIRPPDPSELPIPVFLLKSRGRRPPLDAGTASACA